MQSRIRSLALAALLGAAGGLTAAADGHAHEHAAAHGGIFVEGKEADYELVATPQRLQLQGVSSSNFPVRWPRHADGCAKRGLPITRAIGKPCDKAGTAWRGRRTGK